MPSMPSIDCKSTHVKTQHVWSQAAAYLPVVCPNVCGSKVNAGRCVVLQEVLTSLLSPSACQKLSAKVLTRKDTTETAVIGSTKAAAAEHIHFMTG